MSRTSLVALVVALLALVAILLRLQASQATFEQPATANPAIVDVILQEMSFSPGRIEAPAGTVTLRLTNAGSLEHDFSIDALRISPNVRPGQTVSVSFEAAPGNYPIYCSLPGHKDAGMAGTLVVVP